MFTARYDLNPYIKTDTFSPSRVKHLNNTIIIIICHICIYTHTHKHTHTHTNKHTHIAGPNYRDGLRRVSAASRLLRLWVRIPPEAWMFVVCGHVEVSATRWSLIQRSPTQCGASLCVIKRGSRVPCLVQHHKKNEHITTVGNFISISHKKLLANSFSVLALHIQKLRVLINTLCLEAGNSVWWGIRRQHLKITGCFDRE